MTKFGQFARWIFFAVAGGLLSFYLFVADWSMLDTAFSQLTLRMIGGHLFKAGLVFLVSVVWFKWAFCDTERRNYRAWAYLGFVCLAGGLAIVVVFY